MSNAWVHQPEPRLRDGQRTVSKHQTVLRQGYAETAERGVGLGATHC